MDFPMSRAGSTPSLVLGLRSPELGINASGSLPELGPPSGKAHLGEEQRSTQPGSEPNTPGSRGEASPASWSPVASSAVTPRHQRRVGAKPEGLGALPPPGVLGRRSLARSSSAAALGLAGASPKGATSPKAASSPKAAGTPKAGAALRWMPPLFASRGDSEASSPKAASSPSAARSPSWQRDGCDGSAPSTRFSRKSMGSAAASPSAAAARRPSRSVTSPILSPLSSQPAVSGGSPKAPEGPSTRRALAIKVTTPSNRRSSLLLDVLSPGAGTMRAPVADVSSNTFQRRGKRTKSLPPEAFPIVAHPNEPPREAPTGRGSAVEEAVQDWLKSPSEQRSAEPKTEPEVEQLDTGPLHKDSGWNRLAQAMLVHGLALDLGVPAQCLQPARELFMAYAAVPGSVLDTGEFSTMRDGQLDKSEFKAILQKLTTAGPAEANAAAQSVFDQVEREGREGISFCELADWLAFKLKRLAPVWQLDGESLEDILTENPELERQQENKRISAEYKLNGRVVERYWEEFRAFDAGGSGTLDRESFTSLLSALTKKSISELPAARLAFWWQSADLNNNGKIEFPEFVRFHRQFFEDDGKGVSVVANHYYSGLPGGTSKTAA